MLQLGNSILPMMSLADMQAAERRDAEQANSQPVLQGLAGHVRRSWDAAYQAKRQTVEQRLLSNLRQRNGEYDPEDLAKIRQTGGSEIFMMLTSNKCRAASSWIRDVVIGVQDDRTWSIEPTRLPTINPSLQPTLVQEAAQEAQALEQAMGQQVVTPAKMRDIANMVKDKYLALLRQDAQEACSRMADKMEDQLQEGGFYDALNEFIDDLVTFPFAVLKGPVVRNKPELNWQQGPDGNYTIDVVNTLVPEWERVDPFKIYWAPNSSDVDDGYMIELHDLSRQALEEMLGVDGYNDASIRAVLDEYGRNGLHEWLYIDIAKAQVEGKSISAVYTNPETTIHAIQYWGSVQGKMLIEWGMDESEVPDPLKDYPCEVWLIGRWVIKAVLNYDPLGRKPYFKACYEEVPGGWCGNGIPDLIHDCQSMCNTAARSLANNMGISSGPQVWVNVERLPAGEDITQMYPWKIWQGKSDPYGGNATPPFGFFQPESHAQELMAIYQSFAALADEYSSIPRYMTGDASNMGSMRTSSGISMLMSNAGKSIKQVIYNIDTKVITPMLERLYFHNMRYEDDPDLKGDVRIVARGASALVVKEQTQQRRNEFLQIVASNPMFMDIVGEEAIASLLREIAKTLDMDSDQIVPPPEVIRARIAAQQNMAMLQAQAALGGGQGGQGAPGGARPQRPMMPAARGPMPGNGQNLGTGAPVTDTFQPMRSAQ